MRKLIRLVSIVLLVPCGLPAGGSHSGGPAKFSFDGTPKDLSLDEISNVYDFLSLSKGSSVYRYKKGLVREISPDFYDDMDAVYSKRWYKARDLGVAGVKVENDPAYISHIMQNESEMYLDTYFQILVDIVSKKSDKLTQDQVEYLKDYCGKQAKQTLDLKPRKKSNSAISRMSPNRPDILCKAAQSPGKKITKWEHQELAKICATSLIHEEVRAVLMQRFPNQSVDENAILIITNKIMNLVSKDKTTANRFKDLLSQKNVGIYITPNEKAESIETVRYLFNTLCGIEKKDDDIAKINFLKKLSTDLKSTGKMVKFEEYRKKYGTFPFNGHSRKFQSIFVADNNFLTSYGFDGAKLPYIEASQVKVVNEVVEFCDSVNPETMWFDKRNDARSMPAERTAR